MILVCHVFLTRPRDQKGLVILWVRPLSYDPSNFDGHRHSSNGGIMFLVCHVILT